jgi:hypothetical protein
MYLILCGVLCVSLSGTAAVATVVRESRVIDELPSAEAAITSELWCSLCTRICSLERLKTV